MLSLTYKIINYIIFYLTYRKQIRPKNTINKQLDSYLLYNVNNGIQKEAISFIFLYLIGRKD